MKLRRHFLFILWLAIAAQPLFAQNSTDTGFNCFSIIVGKNASVDGSAFLAHNEDDYGTQLVNFFKVERQTHPANETITFKNGGEMAQVRETYSYLWFQMPTMPSADSYINEFGVVIASDACASREKNPELTTGGIIYWLRRIVAERATTAREAVKIAGELIETYGYASSGRSYVIADPNEGWMLAAVHGKHWVAQRVPDDHVAVIPNYYTIGAIDLADTNNFLASPDLIQYAQKNNWYDPETDGEFNFRKAYAANNSLNSPGNIHRMWRGVNLIAGTNFDTTDEFPFSVKPAKKIALTDLYRVLRDHYEGTELDKSNNYQLGTPHEINSATICASSNQYGFVAQLRNWLPVEIGAVIWFAPRRPDSQPFIPFYLGIDRVPDNYHYDDPITALRHHFNPPQFYYDKNEDHAFWTFWKLADWVDQDYAGRINEVRQRWDEFESTAIKKQAGFETELLAIYQQDRPKAKSMLTKYSTDWAQQCTEIARSLRSQQ